MRPPDTGRRMVGGHPTHRKRCRAETPLEGAGSNVQVTELATSQMTATQTITVEPTEADETPAVPIARWPAKPTIEADGL